MKAQVHLLLTIFLIGLSTTHLHAQSADTPLKSYHDSKGTANATGYATGRTWILIQFKDNALYLYTNASCGAEHIRELKRLAKMGEGLDAYISRHVWKKYERRLQ